MGSSSRHYRAPFLALIAAGLLSVPASAHPLNTGIWKVMRDAVPWHTFDDEEDHAWPVGDIKVGGRHYRLMDYAYLQSKRHMVPGGVQHGHTRLLVFEIRKGKMTYSGGYTYFAGDFSPYGARPHIEGNVVVFPYDKALIKKDGLNDRIVFDKKGPPGMVVLDGDICNFER